MVLYRHHVCTSKKVFPFQICNVKNGKSLNHKTGEVKQLFSVIYNAYKVMAYT